MVYFFIYALNLIDLFATLYLVNEFGIEIEVNLFGRWLLTSNFAILYKIVGVGAALFALYTAIRRKPAWQWILRLMLLVFVALTIYHIIAFLIAYRIRGTF